MMARILIADNASFMRSCLKYIVENAGHEVVGMAKEGGEAVAFYGKLKPDLVTLDDHGDRPRSRREARGGTKARLLRIHPQTF
jgi:chemotaxis response regulator CheB